MVIFFGCSEVQLPYLLNIKKKGYKIILIDKNVSSKGSKYSDFFFNLSYEDHNEIINNLLDNKLNPSKIFIASSQISYLSASIVAKKFNINFISPDKVKICLNKVLFYEIIKEFKFYTPKYELITSHEDLIFFKKENREKSDKFYFLKSDLGKSPSYIYSGTINQLLSKDINWTKDCFLEKFYLLQEEYKGKSIRVNLHKNKFYFFDFETGLKLNDKVLIEYFENNICQKLINLSKWLEVNNLISKFDFIVNSTGYALLDIGLDPPSRLLAYYKEKGKNFYDFYTDIYLNDCFET